MYDLIRRQDAIDALKKYEELESNNFTDTSPIIMMTVATIANCIEEIVTLPSAQPEVHEKRMETHGVCSDGMIKRTDAIDAIKQVTIHAEDESLAVEALENLSSAQRKGKWIHGDEMPDYPRVPYKPWMRYCSHCGEMTGQDDNALFDYCPCCGAWMKGEEDETD